MKLQNVALLLVLIFCLGASCKKNDDSNDAVSALNGNWNLKNVSGGLAGINIDYEEGLVIWNFNDADGRLIVENNILTDGPESIYAVYPTGAYTFEVKIEENEQVLYVNNVFKGYLTVDSTQLLIDDGIAADGFMTEFAR